MNPIIPRTWTHDRLSLIGNSTAGISTSLVCPEAGVAFDVAQGLPWAFNIPNYLITHCHMDHAAGIPYIISQKALAGLKPGTFYMPHSMVDALETIMQTWMSIEGHEYEYQFVGTEPDKEYPLKGFLYFKTFPTVHRVDSQGYCVYQRNKTLKKEFKGLSRDDLIKKKESGVELEDHYSRPILAFTGDTQIEFLDLSTDVKNAQILVMEVTYIDSKKSVESAREWGHIHFDELIDRLPHMNNEKIVLMHLSARYSCKEFREILRKTLSKKEQDRVVVFPRDGQD